MYIILLSFQPPYNGDLFTIAHLTDTAAILNSIVSKNIYFFKYQLWDAKGANKKWSLTKGGRLREVPSIVI